MKYLIVSLAMILSGCATTQSIPNVGEAKPIQIPKLPKSLSEKAERLPPLQDNSLATLLRDGLETDKLYNDKAIQLNNLIDLYNCVREASNEQDSSKIDNCLKE